MKKIIFVLFSMFLLVSCAREDGIYPSDKGWDCVYHGKEYRYRVEADGLYLYTSFDSGNIHWISFVHKMKDRRITEETNAIMKFLCINKDDDYAYVLGYENIRDYYGQKIIGVSCSINDSIGFIGFRENIKSISLLEKYLNR